MREEKEGRFYSTSIPVRVPLRVTTRRSARAEHHSEVHLAFSLKLILPDEPIFSYSTPRRILAIVDWDFNGSHALPFADQDVEVCWPNFEDDVAVRMKDTEEMYRFQILIDGLTGALPIDVQLNK